eukprot:TRINITY_DN55860_c0_g1_i1.p1 TRINITY_DN55860_c0_g1~~TRINITY_DN55860_c0_g1_i1.p1  ORF type:complete len:425 (-),score=55.64 TRINITY_DN55860_c0_g1_i1:1616-2890(-)
MFHSSARRSRADRVRVLFRRVAHRIPQNAVRLLVTSLTLCVCALVLLVFKRNLSLRAARGELGPSADGHFFDRNFVRRANLLWRTEPQPDKEYEVWNNIKYDVVIAVKTGHEVASKRLKSLRKKGWWRVERHVPNFLVVSDADDEALGTIGLKKYALDIVGNVSSEAAPTHWFEKSGWKGDKDKNLPAVHLMRSIYPGKKWYVLLDDDTYIFLENFAKYVSREDMNTGDPVYTGKVFFISHCAGFERDGSLSTNHSAPKGVFAHGGSGIVMNGKAVEAMYEGIPKCICEFSSCWAGDMQISVCLRKHGVMMTKRKANRNRHGYYGASGYTRHFTPFSATKALSDKRYSHLWKGYDLPITFHKMGDREMEAISELERISIATNSSVHYTALREHLFNNEIWPDHSAHNQQTRYYSTEFMPKHLKR